MTPIPPPILKVIISRSLGRYTALTEKDLVDDLLAIETQFCDSVVAIHLVPQQHAQTFHGHSRLMTCLRILIDELDAFSPTLSEIAIQYGLPPVQLVFSAVNIFLAVAMNDAANCDTPVDLFDYAEHILRRLKIHPEIAVDPGTTRTLVKIIIKLTSVFAIATKQVKEVEFRKYARTLPEENDMENDLPRLDRPVPERARKTATPTLEAIHDLVNNLALVMEGQSAPTEGMRYALCDIQQVASDIARVDRHMLQQELRQWLSPQDPSRNHDIARKVHRDGTSTWFIGGKIFKNWKTTGELLWIHSKPSSGKCGLSSTIVHNSQLMGDGGLATVNFREPAMQETHGLLSSLLSQLCSQSDLFCDILSSLHVTYDRGLNQPGENELAKCLRDIKDQERAPIFIVVDALDECPISQGILTSPAQALDIVKKGTPRIHFCMTIGTEIDNRHALDPLEPHNLSLHDQAGQLEDIAQYVKSVGISDVTMRAWSKEVKKLAFDALAKNGCGMFRLTSCQLETLRDCPSQENLSTLTPPPRTLEETYECILQRIGPEKWKHAHLIFQFLTVSARPLYVHELAEIFAIRTAGDTIGIPDFNPCWRQRDAESAVLSVCSSLVAVVKAHGEQIVQFSHYSVREFLMSTRLRDQCSTYLSRYYILPRSAHTLVAKVCLSVLLRLNHRIHGNSLKRMFPLATYAAKHWVSHAHLGDTPLLMEDGMDRLFDKDKFYFAAWIWVYNMDNPSGPHMNGSTPEIPETAPLYYAALCGFIDMARRLVRSHPEDVNSRGRDGRTPLHAALRNCHSDIALLLLEHSADPNSRDSRDETPLQIASRLGDVKAIQSLISSGANLDAQNKDNETSLSLASREGTLEAAVLLLKHGAGVDQRVVLGRTALHVAVERGHHSIVHLLLNTGANVDAQDRHRQTPLHLAADQGDVCIARLLLRHGANVDARDQSQLTPLHIASSGGQVATVQLLLDNRADVNTNDGEGWTALHLAAYNGYLDVAELLLVHGAVCDSKNYDGNTPLHIALANHHTKIAELLVESQQESPKGLKQEYQEHTLIISVG